MLYLLSSIYVSGIITSKYIFFSITVVVMKDFKYADSHEWVKVDGTSATVGISDHAQVNYFLSVSCFVDLFLWSLLLVLAIKVPSLCAISFLSMHIS